jgi:excisionase family DNA binding protein
MAARECSSMNLRRSEATHVPQVGAGPRGVAGNGAHSRGETAGSTVASPPSTLDEPVSADGPFALGTSPGAAHLPFVLTADEAAELLRVDRKTVYGLIARGEMPGVRRLGRAVRIHRDTMLAWMAHGQGRAPRSRGFR